MEFNEWYEFLQSIATSAGVNVNDKESFREDYDNGLSPEEVIENLVEELG